MTVMTVRHKQIFAGLTPPQVEEALIRQVWPSVAASPGLASLGSAFMNSRILAPLGWLLLAPLYFIKVLPGLGRRYAVTNRRVMVQRGVSRKPAQQVALADIDEVRIVTNSNSKFYRTGTLEIISKGAVVLTLPGVPNPESFRHAILNASKAWVPGKAETGNFIPASAKKPA
jgi:hypothetical protein